MSQVVFKTPNTGVLVRAGLWLAVLGAGAWFLSKIRFTLVVFGLAWLIAYLMNGVVVSMIGRSLGPLKSITRGMAVGIIYLALGALLSLMMALLFPQVESQVTKLLQLQHMIANPTDLAAIIQSRSDELLSKVPQEYRETLMARVKSSLDTITAQIGSWLVTGLNALAGFFAQMVTGMFVFISALLVSIYMLLTWGELGQDFVGCFPLSYRDEVRDLLVKMNAIFGGYLRATIVTSAACAFFTLLAVWITALLMGKAFPYALVIALVAGLTYPIPIFGILASTLAAVVLSFMSTPTGGLGYGVAVGVAVFIVNSIIDRTLQPKLMGDAIGVSPLFVMFAAAAGGEFLGGVWGMLLGIPLAAMAKALWAWFHGRFLAVHEETEVAATGAPIAVSDPGQPPVPAPSAPVPAPSAPVPAPSAPVSAPSAPVPAPSAPVPAPSAPVPAASAPAPTPTAPPASPAPKAKARAKMPTPPPAQPEPPDPGQDP